MEKLPHQRFPHPPSSNHMLEGWEYGQPQDYDFYLWAPPYIHQPVHNWDDLLGRTKRISLQLNEGNDRKVFVDTFATSIRTVDEMHRASSRAVDALFFLPHDMDKDLRKAVMTFSERCYQEAMPTLFVQQSRMDDSKTIHYGLNTLELPWREEAAVYQMSLLANIAEQMMLFREVLTTSNVSSKRVALDRLLEHTYQNFDWGLMDRYQYQA